MASSDSDGTQVLPLLQLSSATADSDRLSDALEKHSFCVLRGLPTELIQKMSLCDRLATAFLARHASDGGPSLRLEARRTRTRLHSACDKGLPLIGIGVSHVRDGARLVRVQLHLVADEKALSLVPWPKATTDLRNAVTDAILCLHTMSTKVLAALRHGGSTIERGRADQAAALGDPSVLDLFWYPNAPDGEVNMRAHADPGLLTLTLASQVAGLQVRDRASGTWVDVEAHCEPDWCIVMCGEALAVASLERYEACLHRVACDSLARPRLSNVFELRVQAASRLGVDTVLPSEAAFPAGSVAAARTVQVANGSVSTTDTAASDEAMEEGRAYTLEFVRARLRRGHRPMDVLQEFNVRFDACQAESLSDVQLAHVIFDWVQASRNQEAAADAFMQAEYVAITPAFADCTGRWVDVTFEAPSRDGHAHAAGTSAS